jgi:hypothetical protein
MTDRIGLVISPANTSTQPLLHLAVAEGERRLQKDRASLSAAF